MIPLQRKIFGQCYDARELIQAKEIMQPYSVTKLSTRDLVCIEVQMMRWKPNREGENQYRWVEWKTKLELKAIYLLGKAKAVATEKEVDIEFAV